MTMTDPIADMLTRIRNANQVQFEKVKMPASKVKAALAEVLEREGYIAGFEVADAETGVGKTLEITMKYAPDRSRTISGIKRVSKPGLRIYAQADQIPRVLGGIGVAVVSTSKGLMSDREARRNHLGGEVLCYVW